MLTQFSEDSRTQPDAIDLLRRAWTAIGVVSVPMFLVLCDADGAFRFVGMNSAQEARSGLDTAEIAGQRLKDVLGEDTAQVMSAALARCRDTGEPQSYLEPVGPRTWQVAIDPIKDRYGKVIALTGTSTDISARQDAQAGLRAQIADLQSESEAICSRAYGAAQAARGPLQTLHSLAKLHGGEIAPTLRTLLMETACRGLTDIDRLGAYLTEVRPSPPPTEIALAPLLRQLGQTLDPRRRVSLDFPDRKILADEWLVGRVSQTLLTALVPAAHRSVSINVAPDMIAPDRLCLSGRADADPCSTRGTRDLLVHIQESDAAVELRNTVNCRGGTVHVSADTLNATVTMRVTIPGAAFGQPTALDAGDVGRTDARDFEGTTKGRADEATALGQVIRRCQEAPWISIRDAARVWTRVRSA